MYLKYQKRKMENKEWLYMKSNETPFNFVKGNKLKKIVFVLNGLGVGGAEIQTITVANLLAEKGYMILVIALDRNRSIISRISKKVTVVSLDKNKFFSSVTIIEMVKLIRQWKPEVLLTVNSHSTLYGMGARLFCGYHIPLVSVQHTTIFGKKSDSIKNLLYMPLNRRADEICFVCKPQQDYWMKRYHVRNGTSEVIRNGINLSHFHQQENQQRIELIHPSEKQTNPVFTLCTVAAFRPEKRQEDLVIAVSKLRSMGYHIHIIFVGDGDRREHVASTVRKMNLESAVTFTGNITDIRPWVAHCDAFVLTSIAVETLSIAAIEAMALGKPLILSDIGGASDLVEIDWNGYLYQAGNIEELVNCIKLVTEPGTAYRLGQNSRTRCIQRYDENDMVNQYEKMLSRLADKKKKCIVMLGPSFHTKGGISSVLCLYRNWFYKHAKHQVQFIPTYDGSSRLMDILYFGIAVVRTLLFSIFKKEVIFHIHTASKGSFFRKAILIKMVTLFGKKVCLHMHGGGFDRFLEGSNGKKKAERIKVLQKATRIISLSDSWKRYYSKYVEESRIVVLRNPVVNNETVKQKQININLFRFLYLGRMSKEKGTYDLLQAVKKIEDMSFLLQLYGDGDLSGISQFIQDHHLSHRVVVNGWVPYAEIGRILKSSDALVLTSYAEGLPMAVLEAMGHGLPVIASRVGGIPEVVLNGKTGFLVDAGDIETIADRMKKLIQNPTMAREMGECGTQLAQESFDINTICEQLTTLYDEI